MRMSDNKSEKQTNKGKSVVDFTRLGASRLAIIIPIGLAGTRKVLLNINHSKYQIQTAYGHRSRLTYSFMINLVNNLS